MADEQTQKWWTPSIPKIFNYVWMGKKPEKFGVRKTEAGEVIPGRAIDGIKQFARSAGYKINLWIDVFSMLEDNELKTILGDDLWTAYDTIQVNRYQRTKPGDEIPPKPRTLNDCFDTLVRAQAKVSRWLGEENNLAHFRQTNIYFRYFYENGICGDGSGVEVKFLDTDRYAHWIADEEKPEYGLATWIFFERYARGANWGAASDMIRVQILINEAGFYIDHDDIMKKPFDRQPCGMAFTRVSAEGGGKYSWTNSFLGFCSRDHPYLLAYRKAILGNYQSLWDNQMMWEDRNYTILQQPLGRADKASAFELQTLKRTGPEAFQSVSLLKKVTDAIGPTREILDKSNVQDFIEGNSSKAWLM